MLVPKLRFPGFEDEWQVVKLGDIAHFSKGAGVSKSDIDLSGSREAIRYGELYTIYGEVVGDVHSKIIPSERDVLSEDNDVLIPSSGETAIDISTATYVGKNGVAVGGDLNIIRTNESGRFLSYLLNHGKKLDVARLAQGVSVVHLYASELKGLQIEVPAKEEQEKIADFLMAVDERIELQSHKVEKLETYKRGLTQKIFTRTLRFKRSDGSDFSDWGEKRLGDFANIYQPVTISQDKIIKGEYPVYGANGVIGYHNSYNHELPQIAVTCRGNTCGTVNFTTEKSWITGNAMVINVDDSTDIVDKIFLLQMLKFSDLSYLITGSGQPQITGEIKKHKVSLPSLEEQQKIATFLSQIDGKITLEAQKLEELKKLKKALLQRMFV